MRAQFELGLLGRKDLGVFRPESLFYKEEGIPSRF